MGIDDMIWPTLTLLLGSVSWLVGTGLRRGALLSPYSLILLILISIFGVRPLLMPDSLSSYNFYGYDISRGYGLAALIGFIGTMAFIAGYAIMRFVDHQRAVGRSTPGSTHRHEVPMVTPERATLIAWGLLLSWVLLMIILGSGPAFLAVLFAGRSEASNAVFIGVPAIVPALPVVGCLVVATVRFRWERLQRYSTMQNVAYWLVAIAAVVPPSAMGTRRFLIPSVVIMLVGTLTNSWRRKVKPLWLAAGAVVFLLLAMMPFVRSAGSRVGERTNLLGAMGDYFQVEGIKGTLDNFFLSYDTEMFNYVAYLAPRLGDAVPYGMGRGTAGEILAQPIPQAFSPIDSWNDILLGYAFGAGGGAAGVRPVPSVVGVLFFDLSFAGVLLGMLGLGLLAGIFERSLLRSSGAYTAVLLLAAGFSIQFARGNSMAQVWIAVQVFVMWWVAYEVAAMLPGARWRSRRRPRSGTVSDKSPAAMPS